MDGLGLGVQGSTPPSPAHSVVLQNEPSGAVSENPAPLLLCQRTLKLLVAVCRASWGSSLTKLTFAVPVVLKLT